MHLVLYTTDGPIIYKINGYHQKYDIIKLCFRYLLYKRSDKYLQKLKNRIIDDNSFEENFKSVMSSRISAKYNDLEEAISFNGEGLWVACKNKKLGIASSMCYFEQRCEVVDLKEKNFSYGYIH